MSNKKSVRDYIPNLDRLYKKVIEFVKANQGEKGYIDCQPFMDEPGDIIYGIIYDDDLGAGIEKYIYGVRVKEGDLECLLEDITRTYRVKYTDEDFVSEESENHWMSVRWSDVYYIPTLFNIAEAIEEYA